MESEQLKTFENDMFKNITKSYIKEYDKENSLDVKLIDLGEDLEGLLNCEISDEKFKGILKKLGIPEELAPTLDMIRKSIDYFMQFFEQSFESLHDSICNISFQLHTDKIERAKQARKQVERALNAKNPNEEIKNLLRDLTGYVISNLISDMEVKVYEIREIPRDGEGKKKMLFGWLKVKKIRNDLAELKETLPVYVDTILLISRMDVYLGEIVNAQMLLKDAQEIIGSLFPYKQSSENRMYTLTDDNDWIELPQKYCEKLEKDLNQIELLTNKRNTQLETMQK